VSDVLAQLMRWMETSDIDDAGVVLRDAITEIAGLRARLHEHRIAAQRLAELSGARQQAETGQPVLSDAERDLLLRLGPSADASAAYRAQLSPEDRRTAYALLERLGGGR
jgi:hypothetical protein